MYPKEPYPYTGGIAVGGRYGEQINAYNAQQGIQGLQNAANPPAIPALDELEKALTSRLEFLQTLTARAAGIADRAFGPQPAATGAQGATPAPQSSLDRLRYLVDFIGSQCNALADEIARLERL